MQLLRVICIIYCIHLHINSVIDKINTLHGNPITTVPAGQKLLIVEKQYDISISAESRVNHQLGLLIAAANSFVNSITFALN